MQCRLLLRELEDVLMRDQTRFARHERNWILHYDNYNQPLSDRNARRYAADLMEFEPELVERALNHWWLKMPEEGHRPRPALPCEILALINRTLPERQEATELASQVWGLLSYPGSGNVEEVNRRATPIGAECLKTLGGVSELCRTLMASDRAHFIAQFRDLAVPKLRRQAQQFIHTNNHGQKRLDEPAEAESSVNDSRRNVPSDPRTGRLPQTRTMQHINSLIGAVSESSALPV